MASLEKRPGKSVDPTCFCFRELPVKIDTGNVDPEVAKADDRALAEMTRFSLCGGVIDPETLREQLQNRGNKSLHPLADRVGNWLRVFQHRPSHTTAA